MRAVVITEPGSPEVLRLRDVPDPGCGVDQLLVRVAATSVNRADLLQRRGLYPAPPGAPRDIPGLEFAGTVEAVGHEVAGWAPGDRAMGLLAGGGYAELVAVPADHAIRVPDSLDLTLAAAVPEVFITAHDALHTRARQRPGDSVLIHAVASGVGTAALQLAIARRAATTIGTSRSAWKLERARDELGLDTAIDATEGPFRQAVLDATGGRGADVVIELVGGDYVAADLECIATLGRIVLVGLTAGRSAHLDLANLLGRRATLVGTVLRSRTAAEKADATRAFVAEVLPLLSSGRLRPIVHDVLDMRDAARAHAMVEANETFGSVVLKW